MKLFFKTFVRICSIVLSILGVISWIFPFGEVDGDNIVFRLIVVIILLVILFVISVIQFINLKHKNSIEIYKKGKTTIIFQYKKLEEILDEYANTKSTIVVPINTFLPYVGNKEKIRNTSIHYQVLDYLQKHNIKLTEAIVRATDRKNINMCDENNCSIGDWFILSLKEKNSDSDLKFLFLVSGKLKKENGRINVVEPTKVEYLESLQSLCDAIIKQIDMEEDVFIPLIGAGNANVGKSADIMKVLADILFFNRSGLRQHINVFIDPKHRSETRIVELKR